jgi:predicted amidohydrolase YtcJ
MKNQDYPKRASKGDVTPDLILHSGTVITLNRSSTMAEALAVRGDRILGCGTSAELLGKAAPETRRIDLGGRTVVPGFYDAHPHMDREGLKFLGGIPIAGLRSVADICNVVRNAANSVKPGEWIVLMPMGTPPLDYVNRPEQLREGRFPTRYDLDEAAPDNPVYIRAVWGWWSHRPFPSVANSMALHLAGIGRDTPAPYNVEIIKDRRGGEPTGVFLDRSFAPVLEYTLFKVLPRFTYADRIEGVRRASEAYSAVGTTSGYEGHGLTPTVIRAYCEVHNRGELSVRIDTPYSMPTAAMDDRHISDLLYHYSGTASGRGIGDDMFRVEGIMLGNGNPQVAELLGREYPYEQWAGHFIQALPPNDRFVRLAVEAAHLGLRVSRSVCYDLEEELNAYEAIDKKVSIRDRRWVFMHLIQANPKQLKRIKELGLIVTVEPNFMYMASDRFGLDQLRDEGIPLRQLIDAGIPVALGTDNVPHSMLWTMWEALARWDEDSKTRLGQSQLTREEALRLVTQTGHLITWNEDRFGSLEAGKMADLAVLGDNPLTCPEDRIKDIPVDLTFVGGKQVYERKPEEPGANPSGAS